jgi:succinyl-CoA synthetase beta subunit
LRILRSKAIKLYEYQARELFEQYDIAVPSGRLISSPEQASEAVAAFGGNAILKGQVLTGGRGKAGAVRVVRSEQEAESTAQKILAMTVKDFSVKQILVTELLDIQAEYYTSITVERDNKEIVLIVSEAGGMDIEEIAAEKPELIKTFTIYGADGESTTEELSQWLSASFEGKIDSDQAAAIMWNMYRLFRDKDCLLVEINPLAVTANGLIAADAKIVFDDNGVPAHPKLVRLQNPEEYTTDELEARRAGLSFVSLSGEIGCMVNGAGLAMATMDCIKLEGGSPANFLDVGGSSNPDKVLNAMRILLKNERLKAILINIFGGITRCDDVAEGIILACEKLGINLPIVIRLIGTNDQKGRKMLSDAGLTAVQNMTDAIKSAVNCAAGENR